MSVARPIPIAVGLSLAAICGVADAAPTQPLELTNPLVTAQSCEYCHSYGNPPDDFDHPLYAPFFSWRGSMMANAAVDPVFWAGVAIASQDAVDPSETEACIRCHAPRAFLEGRGDAIAQDELLLEDLAGVECEVCHRQVQDAAPGDGQYTIDDTLMGGIVPRRGPWAYDGDIPAPPHAVITDEYIGTSEACGTCHDVSTARERVDDDGVGLGVPFNEQRTYSEWAGSAFAGPGDDFRSCQDCHMPEVADMAACQDHLMMGHTHPEGGRRHDLVGANRFVLELLADEAVFPYTTLFANSLEVLDAFVQTAATLDVEPPASVDLGVGLSDLTVTVTNETGHKLPTGYSEGRVMWLEVVASHDGEVVWTSGAWDPNAQSIEDDAQLRTYQGVAEQYSTGATLHLLANDHWVEDTRIPPRGLAPDPETDPVGDRYVLQDDGTWPHFDEVTYAFAGRPALADVDAGVLEVSVRLLYLINTAEYIEVLAADNVTNGAGDEVALRFDTAGGATPLVLAEQTVEIPIEPAAVGTTGTGDGADSTGTVDGTTGDATTGGLMTSAGSSGGSGAGETGDESGTGEPGQDDDAGGGCSCRSGSRAGVWWIVALVGLVRRRRWG